MPAPSPSLPRVLAATLIAAACSSSGSRMPAQEPQRRPEVLAPLLAAYDAAAPGPERDALAAEVDRAAGQRYATVSRLYWHTSLPAAQAAARATERPILSLRLLGRLDEDLSCANSRFFRTLVYANAELSRYLRDHFVLHWSSERPAPRVTIDFGDGRRLERTVTGNSAHYVLDAEGRVVDALPGLYAPAVFHAELERARAIELRLRGADASVRAAELRAWHRARLEAREHERQGLGTISFLLGARRLVDRASLATALAQAQRAAITKAMIEVPAFQIVDAGADPGEVGDALGYWAAIGQRLFGLEDAPRIFDEQSRALVRALATQPAPGVPPLDAAAFDAMLAALEHAVVADTAQNELGLRAQIRARLVERPDAGFAELNGWIYGQVFHTPASDPWLGLLPRTAYTGLAADGVVAAAP